MDNQSAITQDFDKNWSIIIDAFKEQKEKGLFPFSYSSSSEGEQLITEESFQKTLDTLHDEKFTIAVCGVVKAGKSTFLNSLLFGRDILPAFDTPMTAKLTFIGFLPRLATVAVSLELRPWRRVPALMLRLLRPRLPSFSAP